MSVFDAVRDLDKQRCYRTAEALFKIAIDMDLLRGQQALGFGSFGAYYSDFPLNARDQLSKNFGRIDSDFGYKIGARIGEMVSLYVLAPIINKHTALRAPKLPASLNFTLLSQHRLHPVPKLPGVDIDDFLEQLSDKIKHIRNKANELLGLSHQEWSEIVIMSNYYIENELKKIGVIWADAHSQNYVLDKNSAQTVENEFLKIVSEVEFEDNSDFDSFVSKFFTSRLKTLMHNAGVFDLDFVRVFGGTLAGNAMTDFYNKILKYAGKSGKIDQILDVVEGIILPSPQE